MKRIGSRFFEAKIDTQKDTKAFGNNFIGLYAARKEARLSKL